MHVLLISARADHGGGPKSTLRLARGMLQGGIEVSAAIPQDKPYFDQFRSLLGESNICVLPHRQLTLRALLASKRYCRDHAVTLLHSNGKGAGVYAKLLSGILNIPYVHTPRGVHTFGYGAATMIAYRLYENSFRGSCKAVVFVSQSERDVAKAKRLWVGFRQEVIPNGIDDDLINSEDTVDARTARREERPFTVVTITRFDLAKNMEEAYEVAKRCPQVRFVWIGDGDDRTALQYRADAEDVKNIVFSGFDDNPIKRLGDFDCYLSTSRWEGLPNALLEAGLVSLPSVASRVTGNVDVIVDGHNGLLYEPGNAADAATKVLSLANDLDRSRTLGRAARQVVLVRFSAKATVERYRRLYVESVVSG